MTDETSGGQRRRLVAEPLGFTVIHAAGLDGFAAGPLIRGLSLLPRRFVRPQRPERRRPARVGSRSGVCSYQS